MPKINTRTEFGKKLLRNLGSPVIKINVDDTQIEDAIDTALLFMIDHHRDFMKELYFTHVTDDTDIANGYFVLPETVTSVIGYLETDSSSYNLDNGGFGTYNFHTKLNYNLDYQHGGVLLGWHITDIEIFNMFNETVLKQYDSVDYTRFIFDKTNYQLQPIAKMVKDRRIAIQTWIKLIGEDTTKSNLFTNTQFQDLATALLQETWGNILSKFVGIQMPGAVTLNGEQIKQEAREDIDKIKEKIDQENEMVGLRPYVG